MRSQTKRVEPPKQPIESIKIEGVGIGLVIAPYDYQSGPSQRSTSPNECNVLLSVRKVEGYCEHSCVVSAAGLRRLGQDLIELADQAVAYEVAKAAARVATPNE